MLDETKFQIPYPVADYSDILRYVNRADENLHIDKCIHFIATIMKLFFLGRTSQILFDFSIVKCLWTKCNRLNASSVKDMFKNTKKKEGKWWIRKGKQKKKKQEEIFQNS